MTVTEMVEEMARTQHEVNVLRYPNYPIPVDIEVDFLWRDRPVHFTPLCYVRVINNNQIVCYVSDITFEVAIVACYNQHKKYIENEMKKLCNQQS